MILRTGRVLTWFNSHLSDTAVTNLRLSIGILPNTGPCRLPVYDSSQLSSSNGVIVQSEDLSPDR